MNTLRAWCAPSHVYVPGPCAAKSGWTLVRNSTNYETDRNPEDRRKALDKLALFVRTKRAAGEEAQVTFICTHNSRRSHLSQLWAATAAAYYGVDRVSTYSGGTEATAFNPRAVAAIERAGFHVEKAQGENPRYLVTFGPGAPEMTAFSKKYNDPENPQENFAAVMSVLGSGGPS